MTTILITGYKSFELGIFQNKDNRVEIIEEAIRKDLISYLENGVNWFVFMGNLGFEYWALKVAKNLQKEYDFQIASIFLFEDQGKNWNDANQLNLGEFKTVDFVKYSYPTYESVSQFKNYNQFLVDNTDEAYLFYDSENETNLKYLLQLMEDKKDYRVNFLTFERLNEFLEDR